MRDLAALQKEIENQSNFEYDSIGFWEKKFVEVTDTLRAKGAPVSEFNYLMRTRSYIDQVTKSKMKEAPLYLRDVKKDLLTVIRNNLT